MRDPDGCRMSSARSDTHMDQMLNASNLALALRLDDDLVQQGLQDAEQALDEQAAKVKATQSAATADETPNSKTSSPSDRASRPRSTEPAKRNRGHSLRICQVETVNPICRVCGIRPPPSFRLLLVQNANDRLFGEPASLYSYVSLRVTDSASAGRNFQGSPHSRERNGSFRACSTKSLHSACPRTSAATDQGHR
jgi:hypothetical protein